MNKGFTLIEVLVSLTLLLLTILFSSRIMVSALDQTRKSAGRFRLVEALDYYRNYLSSLPMISPELAEGPHGRADREFQVDWQVEAAGVFLKRIRLAVAGFRCRLLLVLYRSKFIQEVAQ